MTPKQVNAYSKAYKNRTDKICIKCNEVYPKTMNTNCYICGKPLVPYTENMPKCPTCGSLNIAKISATSRVAHGATFGLFSKTARSQFKCNSCGYKW